MKMLPWLPFVLSTCLCTAVETRAQPRVGPLAIDQRHGDEYGWVVDYESPTAAREAALHECGAACSVVLTFPRCGAYAADQDADSAAVGWAESFASGADARQVALAECGSRGGSSCTVRVWGCNGSVVEEALGLDRAARRLIEEGLRSAGFDPGSTDGLFGPRTRAEIRTWQSARGASPMGYLKDPAVEALRSAGASGAAVAAATASAQPAAIATQPSTPTSVAQATGAAELEGLFWQSIMNSTNAAEFEAYLEQFPRGGGGRVLAQARLAALRAPANDSPAVAGTRVDAAGSPASGSRISAVRVSGTASPASRTVAGGDAGVFRDCEVCPEMVVIPSVGLALGRYEVKVDEYQAYALATRAPAGNCLGDSWRNPGFLQTGHHPVTCVNWAEAQAFVSWLSEKAGSAYRLPTEAEWKLAAPNQPKGVCNRETTSTDATCVVGSKDAESPSDMVGNVWEWTEDCWDDDCSRRVIRGGSWTMTKESLLTNPRFGLRADVRFVDVGFRVAKTLDGK